MIKRQDRKANRSKRHQRVRVPVPTPRRFELRPIRYSAFERANGIR